MFRRRRVRTHAKSLVGVTLTLAVIVGWIGPHTSSGVAPDRVVYPAGSSPSRATPSESHEATRRRVVERYSRLPLSFEANSGQADSQVQFVSRGLGYDLFLTSTEAVMIMNAAAPNAAAASTARSTLGRVSPPSSRFRSRHLYPPASRAWCELT